MVTVSASGLMDSSILVLWVSDLYSPPRVSNLHVEEKATILAQF